MNIRKAATSDIESIKDLWKEMMDFHVDHDKYFKMNDSAFDNYQEYLLNNLTNNKFLIFVAEEKSKVIGYISASVVDYPPIYLYEKHIVVGEISVNKNYRRKGAGETLLKEIYKYAEINDIKRIECEVAVKNPVSQNFWLKNNFRPYIHKMVKEL